MTAIARPTASAVLVAEDDRMMSDVIRFNLERGGYEVTVARNGLDAWHLLQERHFDLAVLDYQMPGMTGEQVCRNVRDKLENHSLPVIFLSARGLELNAERMKNELLIARLMFKPFSPRELMATVADSLRDSEVN